MREADERTHLMFEAMPLGAVFLNQEGKPVDCNQEARVLFGLSSKQEFLDRFGELSPEYQPDGQLSSRRGAALIAQALVEERCRFEWTHQTLTGEPIPCEVTLVRVSHWDELVFIGYIRDLREHKAILREMRRVEIAEASNKAKSRFLAMMSHEIRTPMNVILGIVEAQLQDAALPPKTAEAFQRLYASADALLRIINDILDLSKIEAGKLELMPARYELAGMITTIVQQSLIQFSGKPVEFKLLVDENAPQVLFGDEVRVKQILSNLLTNAFKYTEHGTIELMVSAEKGPDSGMALVFRISDTGQGMTVEQVRMLFEEYSRFNVDANRNIEGIGLGMNITQHLIQMMQGELLVESEPGEGSVFTVRVPQGGAGSGVLGKECAENMQLLRLNSAAQAKKAHIVHEPMPYGSVLLVDDLETNLYVAKALLQPYKLSIDTALSGPAAIDKIKRGNVYDLVFMDYMMPRMDGMEAIKAIRDLGYTAPVIALTADAVSGRAEMFLAGGFDGFIFKPIDIRQLDVLLNKLIRDKQTPAVLAAARREQGTGDPVAAGPPVCLDRRLAEIFAEDAAKAIATLEAVYRNCNVHRDADIRTYTLTIHAIKSALASIGESELAALALTLEEAGREKNSAIVAAVTPAFLSALRAVVEKVKST